MKKILLLAAVLFGAYLALDGQQVFSLFTQGRAIPGAQRGDIYYTTSTAGVIAPLHPIATPIRVYLTLESGVPSWVTMVPTFTPTNTPTGTNTPTITPTSTVTPTVTPTNTPTQTPTVTPTSTNTPTVTNTPTAVAAGALTQISQQTLGADATTVTFSSIPGTYTNLVLTVVCRTDQSNTAVDLLVQFNGDAGSNYTEQTLNIRNATLGGSGVVAATTGRIGMATGTQNQADAAAVLKATIFSYANTNWNKHWLSESMTFDGATGTSEILLQNYAGRWKNTAALTSMVLSLGTGKFKTNSVFTLYGMQ